MSSDGTGKEGATNHLGQLFTGEGAEVHEGLVCIDGSVIPTALGEVHLLIHMRNYYTRELMSQQVSIHLLPLRRWLNVRWTISHKSMDTPSAQPRMASLT